MASKFSVEVGPATQDEATLILVDLNTTQIVETFSHSNSRLYLTLWAEGESEAKSALSRALSNFSADYLIR